MTTMAAPTIPLPIDVELYAGGDWQDVSTDVYHRSVISISYGLPDWATSVSPCSCTLLLGNTSGDYDPANAVGKYFGTIGRNTPIRVSIRSNVDTFDRTVSNGWGTSDDGDVWQTFWTGASNSAASFTVSGGHGTQKVTGTNAFTAARTTAVWGDVEIAVTCAGIPTVTGNPLEPLDLMVRGQDTSHFYLIKCSVDTSQVLTLALEDATGLHLVTNLATTVNPARDFRCKVQVEGNTLRAKVWNTSDPEPAGWQRDVNYYENIVLGGAQALDTPGWVGVRSAVAVANTNANPITFTFSDLVIRVPRFAGWAFLTPTSDQTGKDKTVSVTAGSVLRQFSQGTPVLASPLRHDVPTLDSLIAYWPCEDGTAATSFASGISASPTSINGTTGRPAVAPQPMQIVSGTPQLASDSSFVGSAPLPVVNGSSWYGRTGSTDTSGTAQVRFLFKAPTATISDGQVICRAHTTGTVIRWDVVYHTGGSLSVQVFDTTGTLVEDTGTIAFGVDGVAFRIGLSIQPSGSNLSCRIEAYEQLAPTAGGVNFTVTGQSIGTCYAIAIGPPGNNLQSAVVGHVTFENAFTSIFDLIGQVNAFSGEDAGTRLSRLCGYGKLGFAFAGSSTALSMLLGPQAIGQIYSLIQTVATSDVGLLYEPKGTPALAYKSGGGHAHGPADPVVVALDRATHDLSTAPVPAYDDLSVRNDITVTQTDGSSVEVTQLTGPMSIQPPPAGMGSYPGSAATNLNTDAEVTDVASWLLHLGTTDSARYPNLTVNLLRPENADLYWPLLDVSPDSMISLDGETADTILLLARGYTETLSSDTHVLAFNNAPGEPYLCPVFDDGASRWAAGASSLHSGITSSATSFSVDSDDGTLWTTDAGDLPLDIMVGGERMTVGAITGTSSPQTFSSVTRSVNGVVKSHLASEAVDIAEPLYFSLGR